MTDLSKHNKFQIVLVHGTWGRNSPWISPREKSLHSLYDRLRSDFSEIAEIEPLYWTGKNRSSHRREATMRLARLIHQKFNRHAVGKVFLIGHSHGGNIAHDAISMLPLSEADRVFSFCLGTPFIIKKRRFHSLISHEGPAPLDSFMFFACLFSVVGILPVLIFGAHWNPFVLSEDNYNLPLTYWLGSGFGVSPLLLPFFYPETLGERLLRTFSIWEFLWICISGLGCMLGSFIITDIQDQPQRPPKKIRREEVWIILSFTAPMKPLWHFS
jgi:pimeloyl-ACP methyl ester carboxylesterase